MTNTAIGGWWGRSKHELGAIVSSLGINGAELSHWSRWNQNAWQQELATIAPELIILAYGTNEAYNNLSAERIATVLDERIEQIRQASPHSAIMIVSSPEVLKIQQAAAVYAHQLYMPFKKCSVKLPKINTRFLGLAIGHGWQLLNEAVDEKWQSYQRWGTFYPFRLSAIGQANG